MSEGIGSFFRNYQFLDFTKQVAQDQINLGKQPAETWGQIGNTLRLVCWNNTRNIFYTGLDVTTYLAVSILRSQGFCLPPLSAPPLRSYHDDAQFLKSAVERGLWKWNPQKKADVEEAIETCFSDEYNIFAMVGEFCLAYFYENDNGKKFVPSFLKASEPLENNESFHTVGKRFAKLGSVDQRNILEAIYTQKEPKNLSSKAKQVHRDIRALASKLQQGNKGYLGAFQAYTTTKLGHAAYEIPQSTSSQKGSAYPNLSAKPVTPARPVPMPSAPPRVMPQPSAPPRSMPIPSAPPGGPDPMAHHSTEIQMAEELAFVRRALSGCEDLKRQITRNQDCSWAVASLMVIQALRDKLARRSTSGCLPMLQMVNARAVDRVSAAFARLSEPQFKELIRNVITPTRTIPSGFMHFYHDFMDLSKALREDPIFEQVFGALKIDLIAR